MAVQSAPSDAMTVPGNSSARSMNSAQVGQLSQQLTVIADTLPRHCRDFSLGVNKLRHHIGHRGMALFYLVATGALAIFAWELQHVVYSPAPPPGQMYAAVFVRDPAAHVGLSADIDPNHPWKDSLTVTVGRVPSGQTGWLLVIECPSGVPRSPAVPLYSEAAPQAQSAATRVTVITGIASPKHNIMLGCFTEPKSLPKAFQWWVLHRAQTEFVSRPLSEYLIPTHRRPSPQRTRRSTVPAG
jgi:hypothetical protein